MSEKEIVLGKYTELVDCLDRVKKREATFRKELKQAGTKSIDITGQSNMMRQMAKTLIDLNLEVSGLYNALSKEDRKWVNDEFTKWMDEHRPFEINIRE